LKGIRLGVFDEWFNHASAEVVEQNRKMLTIFEEAGAEIIKITIPELDAMRVAHAVTILSEMAACMQNYPENFKDFAASTQLSLVIGQVMSSHDYIQAQRMRTRAMKIFADVLQQVDAIITPATALTAPVIPPEALSNGWSDLSTDTEMMRYVFSGNLTGLPAISFPVGYDSNNMPVGMQAMGRHWEENLCSELPIMQKLEWKGTFRILISVPEI
jgi:Asp-tRNA(Asn)/Glu-tRNA(Gln) amidotransferase A subunit family amidase